MYFPMKAFSYVIKDLTLFHLEIELSFYHTENKNKTFQEELSLYILTGVLITKHCHTTTLIMIYINEILKLVAKKNFIIYRHSKKQPHIEQVGNLTKHTVLIFPLK